MKQHIQILILLISILSISSKTYSQVDISVRNINRGIELCNEGKHELGLFYLSVGLRNEDLSDSLRSIGELYRQISYYITDKDKISYDILEDILPKIKDPHGPLLIYANKLLGQKYTQQNDFKKAHLYLDQSLQECERIGRKDSIEYILCIMEMAELNLKQEKYDESDCIYKYAYKLLKDNYIHIYTYKETFMHLLFAYYHNNYMYLHNYEKALSIAKENSIITNQLFGNLNQKYIQSLIDQSYAYSALGDYKATIELSDSICVLQEKLTGKNNHNYYIALRNKVFAYSEIEDYNNALKYSNELLQLTKNTEYWLDNTNYNISLKHKLGKYEEAIKKQKEIIAFYEENNNTSSLEYIRSISNLRQIYDDVSGYKDELKELNEILISFEFPESATGEEILDIFLCKLYAYHDKSFQEYSAFIKNTISKLDPILYSEIGYQSIKCGMLLDVLYPNYKDAVEYINLHLSFLKDKQMMKSQYGIYALNALTNVYIKNQELMKAISITAQSLALNKELYGEQSISYIDDLDYYSTQYLRIGNINTYIEIQNKMFDIIKKYYGYDNQLYIQKKSNPINAFFASFDSQEYLGELLSILNKTKKENIPSHIYLCIGIAYFQQNNYENAIKYADLKLKNSINSQDSIWGLNLKIASLKQMNKWNKVEECNKLMFAIAKNSHDLEEHISCKEDLARILYKKGNTKQAQTLIKEVTLNKWEKSKRTLSLLPEKERAQFWASQTNIHYKYLPNYLSNQEFETENEFVSFILDNQLRHKGLLLNYSVLFNNIDSQLEDSIYRVKFQNYQSLKRNKERLSTDELQVMNRLENELVAQSNINIDETSFVEVKEKLKDNDLIIEFINYPIYGPRIIKITEEKYAAILLKHNWEHSIIVSLPIDSIAITQRNITYSQIWEPIKDYISPGDNIYFSASGILHQIPIESLPIGNGKIMSDVYNMHRLSSTRELVKEKKEVKYTKAVLYGGLNYDMTDNELLAENQTYSKNASEEYYVSRGLLEDSIRGYKWDNLSNTQQEVDYISDLMKKNQITTQTYKGNKGNEESFKALSGHEYNIIHLATHGFFYPDEEAKEKDYFKPMLLNEHYRIYNEVDMSMWRSGLVMSGGNRAWKGDTIPDKVEDGILKAQEIGDLDLRGAGLVVLSACNTGQGEVTGEGVFGLQRAFKMAGAQTIVMSLTPVDDQTTMAMMNKFYTNLFSGQSKHGAFYNAQRYIRSIKPDPKYWMGWIMLD